MFANRSCDRCFPHKLKFSYFGYPNYKNINFGSQLPMPILNNQSKSEEENYKLTRIVKFDDNKLVREGDILIELSLEKEKKPN